MTVGHRSFDHIPVIDVGAAYDGAEGAREALAAELANTLQSVGFAYIENHGVSQDQIETLRREAKHFFALPQADKDACAINPWHRGYMAPNSSTIVTSSVARVSKPNQSESFLVMHELAPDDPDLLAGKPLQGPNQWPAAQPSLRDSVLAYMAAMEDLSRRLIQTLARGLALPTDFFDPYFDRPTLFLRLLHYPPQAKEAGLFGSAPHTDYGFMTLLAQDEIGGLEVRNAAGQWISAPPIAGTFVMNVGDILSRWTNGRFASTPHRVINLSGRDRYSQPYFFDPSMDAVVAPLPNSVAEGQVRAFAPLRYGDYLMERLDKNYDYRKPATSSGS